MDTYPDRRIGCETLQQVAHAIKETGVICAVMRATGKTRPGSDWQGLRRTVLIGGLMFALIGGSGTSVAGQVSYGEAVAPDGTTPLHQAVRQNDIKNVDALIKRGADVKATTRYGVTPIGLAALNGNAAILRKLLEIGRAHV